jgi:hypothetical protein
MKNLLLASAVLALLSPLASATDGPATTALNNLGGGAPVNRIMDGSGTNTGGENAPVVAGGGNRTVTTGSGAVIAIGARTTGAPPPPAVRPPGFFARTLATVSKPTFMVPALTAGAFGAAGMMIGGPLGLLTGLAIGGLLGWIFTKALG